MSFSYSKQTELQVQGARARSSRRIEWTQVQSRLSHVTHQWETAMFGNKQGTTLCANDDDLQLTEVRPLSPPASPPSNKHHSKISSSPATTCSTRSVSSMESLSPTNTSSPVHPGEGPVSTNTSPTSSQEIFQEAVEAVFCHDHGQQKRDVSPFLKSRWQTLLFQEYRLSLLTKTYRAHVEASIQKEKQESIQDVSRCREEAHRVCKALKQEWIQAQLDTARLYKSQINDQRALLVVRKQTLETLLQEKRQQKEQAEKEQEEQAVVDQERQLQEATAAQEEEEPSNSQQKHRATVVAKDWIDIHDDYFCSSPLPPPTSATAVVRQSSSTTAPATTTTSTGGGGSDWVLCS